MVVANQPDIVAVDKQDKKAAVVEITIPTDKIKKKLRVTALRAVT